MSLAILHEDIVAAEAQEAAGAVQYAVPHDHIVVVKARHTIVTGVET